MLTEQMMVERLGDCFWTFDYRTGQVVNLNAKAEKQEPEKPSMPPVRDWLFVSSDDPNRIISRFDIRKAVCHIMRISLHEFTAVSRRKHLCRARMVYYYLCRELTENSLVAIGKLAGIRDHTTVLSGINKVKASLRDFEPDLNEVRSVLVPDFVGRAA